MNFDLNTALLCGLTVLAIILFVVVTIRKTTVTDSKDIASLFSELRRELQESSFQQRNELQQRIDSLNQHVLKGMSESTGTIQKHFAQTSSVIRDVSDRLTKLDETNKQVLGFSEQLQSLENILKNPKHRGILGEYWLETLLGQVLQPEQYEMQFQLGTDDDGNKLIPDAIIRVRELMIPIDAKFSLENYNRIATEADATRREKLEQDFKKDVTLRINETSKYIRPDLGTTDFAFMFIPAEGVYQNLFNSTVGSVQVNAVNLLEYAFKKRVIIVSPSPFFAFLQTVIMGLRALRMEESFKVIQKNVQELERHLIAYVDFHNKVGKHLSTTFNTYQTATNELKKIDKDIFRVTEGEAGKSLEIEEPTRPALDQE